MGLSFVKEVIDLHGGKILVQSQPDKGSTFSILLPVTNAYIDKEREEPSDGKVINKGSVPTRSTHYEFDSDCHYEANTQVKDKGNSV